LSIVRCNTINRRCIYELDWFGKSYVKERNTFYTNTKVCRSISAEVDFNATGRQYVVPSFLSYSPDVNHFTCTRPWVAFGGVFVDTNSACDCRVVAGTYDGQFIKYGDLELLPESLETPEVFRISDSGRHIYHWHGRPVLQQSWGPKVVFEGREVRGDVIEDRTNHLLYHVRGNITTDGLWRITTDASKAPNRTKRTALSEVDLLRVYLEEQIEYNANVILGASTYDLLGCLSPISVPEINIGKLHLLYESNGVYRRYVSEDVICNRYIPPCRHYCNGQFYTYDVARREFSNKSCTGNDYGLSGVTRLTMNGVAPPHIIDIDLLGPFREAVEAEVAVNDSLYFNPLRVDVEEFKTTADEVETVSDKGTSYHADYPAPALGDIIAASSNSYTFRIAIVAIVVIPLIIISLIIFIICFVAGLTLYLKFRIMTRLAFS
jgi:hypothetical protein